MKEKKEVVKISKRELKQAVSSLVIFATEKKRDFPWRHNQTAYRVLVSELMLQQTQVSRVMEKYEPFIAKFKNLEAIKEATLSELLLEGKGLGYMRRIKSLKNISLAVDTLPKTEEELQALSGIGEYTAGAIMAFAYDIFVPILETNIRTVLCHHFCQKDVSSMCPALSLYPALTTKLFTESKQSPRHFYEAMMDYGAFLKKEKVTVCKKIAKQKAFKGSKRELRAKLLYLITENKMLEMDDSRSEAVLLDLVQEGFIRKSSKGYEIVL